MFQELRFVPACLSAGVCLLLVWGGSGQTRVDDRDRLDGAYEFVSESEVLTDPQASKSERVSGEWAGLWLFQEGHFSRTLMKRGARDGSCESRQLSALGYESFAGRYKLDGGYIELSSDLALSPLEVGRATRMAYKFEGDKLIVTRRLHKDVHNVNEGTVTVVLRRISP